MAVESRVRKGPVINVCLLSACLEKVKTGTVTNCPRVAKAPCSDDQSQVLFPNISWLFICVLFYHAKVM